METISLDLEGRKCRIVIGHNILASIGGIVSPEKVRKFAIITNSTVNSLYGDAISGSLASSGLEHVIFEVADSESSKSLAEAEGLCRKLAAGNFDRDSCIIGLGGGVIGDLAGFVAATYMRGIGLIHIPTTLLAQVDSSIGGKTAVNIPEGKNIIGAFHQPELVVSDIATLDTLPDAEFRSGLAEVLKYGMILDRELFGMMESRADSLLHKDADILEKVVARCGAIKASIVQQDERDSGKRLILNYGHTLGHALEAASGYQWRHGEAVALGMLFAARMSVKSGLLAQDDLQRLHGLMSALCLPTHIERKIDAQTVMRFMNSDKKSRDGKIRFVLPTGIGSGMVSDGAGTKDIKAILEGMME